MCAICTVLSAFQVGWLASLKKRILDPRILQSVNFGVEAQAEKWVKIRRMIVPAKVLSRVYDRGVISAPELSCLYSTAELLLFVGTV